MELVKKCGNKLPSRTDVIYFIKELRKVLYPGYFGEISLNENKCSCDIEKYLNKLFIESICECEECAKDFFLEFKKIKPILQSDIDFSMTSDPAIESMDELIITSPGLFAISLYRIANILYKQRIPIIPRIISEYAHSKTGIDIHPGATIDHDFFIDHGTGIVIGETAVIGHHVKIYHGVTLGALSLAKGSSLRGVKRHPTIGNYVTIYSGASVLGGDTHVGDHSVLGSNIFLMHSVDEYSKVIVDIKIETISKNNKLN